VAVEVQLVGTSAVVTGAGRGVGYAVASHLMAVGADVLVYELDPDRARDAAAQLCAEHPSARALAFPGDVTDEAAMRAAFELASEAFGPPRILVNNALYQYPDLIVRMPVHEWERVFGVVATGTFLGTREFGRHFMEHGLHGGSIVNISTLNYTAPASLLAAYCSAKAAVSQFTQVAALEYASLGIRVNAIAPGLVNTELAAGFFGSSPEVPAAFVRNTPLGRIGEPADQADVAVFFASTASAWITGVTLVVDGGLHLLGVPDNWELFKGPLGKTDPTPADWLAEAGQSAGG
jgi:NAD(P)-dependent dehydrogenase (short-subunit alcohol dehydrogenase family)